MTSNNPHYEADPSAKEVKGNPLSECIIKPRGLNIVWGNDDRYWRVPKSSSDAKPDENLAELLQVCWLEVSCSVGELAPGKNYKLWFQVSLTSDAFGWSGCPVYIMAKMGKKGKYLWKKMVLPAQNDSFSIPDDNLVISVSPQASSPDEKTLYFGLYEVWSGKWKGGLRIHNAFVKQID